MNCVKKSSAETKCTAKRYPLHELTKMAHVVQCVSFLSQFSYRPLVWMFHSRGKNDQINQLHETCLRIIYNDKKSIFTGLIEKDNSVSINKGNLGFPATEMFKLKKGFALALIKETIQQNRQKRYDLQNNADLILPCPDQFIKVYNA